MKLVSLVFTLFLSSLLVVGCAEDDAKDNSLSKSDLLGAWQTQGALQEDGKSYKKLKIPHPNSKKDEVITSTVTQLLITEDRITMMDAGVYKANIVFDTKWDFKRGQIITQDEDEDGKDNEIVNFSVKETSSGGISLTMLFDKGEQPSFDFFRIEEGKLATRSSVWATEPRFFVMNFSAVIEGTPVDLKVERFGNLAFEERHTAVVICETDKEASSLVARSALIDEDKNLISVADEPEYKMVINGIQFDTSQQTEEIILENDKSSILELGPQGVFQKLTGVPDSCTHNITRDGAILDIKSDCRGWKMNEDALVKDEEAQASIFVHCLVDPEKL